MKKLKRMTKRIQAIVKDMPIRLRSSPLKGYTISAFFLFSKTTGGLND